MHVHESLKDITIQLNSNPEKDEQLAFGSFLDDFYRADSKEKYEMLRDEPVYLSEKKECMANLAASAHLLSIIFNLDIPEWVYDKKYIMDRPCFMYGEKDIESEEAKEYFIKTSPIEYKQRNLFYGDNVLCRC